MFRVDGSSNDEPRQSVTRYPVVYSVAGRNMKTNTEVTTSKLLQYAKEHNVHLNWAKEIFDFKKWDHGERDTLMIKTTMDIVAENDIINSQQLLDTLNKKLNDLQVFIERTDNNIVISHKNPHLIVDREIDFAEVVKKHFQFGIEDEYRYEADAYIHNSVLKNEVLDIRMGTRLCTLSFYKGEINISKKIPTTQSLVDKNLVRAVFATSDISTIEGLAQIISSVRKDVLSIEIVNDHARLTVKPPVDVKVLLNERVNAILGLNIDENLVFPKGEVTTIDGKETPVFDVGARKIYIYSDCVAPQRVGDQLAPLLRITDYTGSQGKHAMVYESAAFELSGRPHGEIFSQTRYIPPGIDIRVTFHRTPDNFALECYGTDKANLKLQILEAKLKVQKVTLLPSIHAAILRTWKDHPCVYPGKRVIMKD
ncbi:unnamed protein product [Orchesella dallaii]|uniref:Uncharacterized protein n=1 Tax=Orchesella dallaii TaxID=48710 RepID=A0ABP1RL67_9HEXA